MREQKGKKTVISIPEAREILEKVDPEKTDQIQKRTLDYAVKFSKTTAEKARKIKKQIEEECGLTETEATEIVNTLPRSMEELRVFTAGWKKLLPSAVLEKVIEIISNNV